MGLSKLPLLAAAMSISVCAAAFAQDAMAPEPMGIEEAQSAREEQMKLFGGTMRGIRDAEGDTMIEIANVYVEGFAGLPALFPEGSNTGDSKALDLIWEDWEGFLAVVEKGNTAATALRIAAETGEQAEFLAAAQTLGPVCQECHDTYRAPMD